MTEPKAAGAADTASESTEVKELTSKVADVAVAGSDSAAAVTGGEAPPAGEKKAEETAEAGKKEGEGDKKKSNLKPFKKMALEVQRADPNSPLFSATSFNDLGLPKELLDGVLLGMKFDKPSKIQEAALPIILGDKAENLIGQAQSGTGKTAAFVLCMLFRVDPAVQAPQAVCLCHTRELAEQTFQVVRKMGQYTKISVRLLIGGDFSQPRPQRIDDQILICTPGKLSDCLGRSVNPAGIKCLVLDEADHILEAQNSKETCLRIKRRMPKTTQYLLFSATFKDAVMAFAEKMVPNPNVIRLKTEDVSLDNIKQYVLRVDNKFEALSDVYDLLEIGQSIVFVETRRTADNVNAQMNDAGHKTAVIHSKVENRTEVMRSFRDGESRVLISTRLLARGIDVEQVTLVVLYEVPMEHGSTEPAYEDYIHMIGRSGRFGKYGLSLAIVDNDHDYQLFKDIERFYNRPIVDLSVDDIESLQDVIKATL